MVAMVLAREEERRESLRFARIGCLVNQCSMVEVGRTKSQLNLELKTSIEGMVRFQPSQFLF
ncbi:hypothetical protein Scep_015071 [Stephania cephalantha]|uniref:Uncharacterized protein n=1 Tax=Stephania cephalantha TaxID=152367 RepID=A0AAP0J3Y2_9MAGN